MSFADFISDDANEWARGLALAHLSQIAYDGNPTRRRRRFSGMGLEEISAIEGGGTGITGLNAYVLRHSEDILIVIRGSQETNDWISNFRFEKTPYKNVLVHNGFAASTRRLEGIFSNRRDQFMPYQRIWLTGHSLGGAVAQLAGYALARAGNTIANVTTFGAPRVGGPLNWRNRVLDRGLGQNYIRWVNYKDLVSRIPFTGASAIGFIPGIEAIPVIGPILQFLLRPAPKNLLWRHVGRLFYIDIISEAVQFDSDRRLGGPIHDSSDARYHKISGFGIGHDAGYIRSICQFMPEGERLILEAETTPSLADSVLALNAIDEREHPVALSSFSEILDTSLSLASIGLRFR